MVRPHERLKKDCLMKITSNKYILIHLIIKLLSKFIFFYTQSRRNTEDDVNICSSKLRLNSKDDFDLELG